VQKQIRLMADYGAYPLWDLDPESIGPINPADLPLKMETLLALRKWSEKYQAQLNIADPARSETFNARELKEFEEEGLGLWRLLREELQPEYEIEYFSESKQRSIKTPEEPG
jgi:hypothetical protein